MVIHISEYSAQNFNRLGDFQDVLRRFNEMEGNTVVATMQSLFRRHKVEHISGLSLLHKHYALDDNEKLTDVRGTSNPLSFDIGNPSIWGFNAEPDELQPLEYSVDSQLVDWHMPSIQDFLAEFRQCLLHDKEASGILGLSQYPGDGYPGRVEFTVGRSNINLLSQEAALLPSTGTREAAWFFTDAFLNRGCKCNCFNRKGHTHTHGYTI